MFGVRFMRENIEKVKKAVKDRGEDLSLDRFIKLDRERRAILTEVEKLRYERNVTSEKIGELKRRGEDADEIIDQMKDVSSRIKRMDEKLEEIETKIEEIIYSVPNIPDSDVPVGNSEEDNKEIKRWGEPREFSFEPLPHWEIGERLSILDFERGSKISGSRFTVLKGAAAKLERALISFMLDLHIEEHGYQEIFPPFMVNSESMFGTGQLPKFKEDMFRCQNGYYLIPTAEVPVTNLYRDETFNEDELPVYHVAYSACFRAEAGAHGRDTRGIIRQHQFNKVELVKFTAPDESYDELEKLTLDAEKVLKLLELPYRVVVLCTGDLGFSAAKTYDLEVWMPGSNSYREISSCSNFLDFQARRIGIHYRPETDADSKYVHTLNGSGVAIGRTMAALLETYQNKDGTVNIPEVLVPYMGGTEIIK